MQVSLRRFSLALDAPVETPGGRVDRRDGVLVGLESGDLRGVGEATPLPGWTETYDECIDALEAAREAVGADGPGALLSALDPTPAARHGVALALADLEARRDGRPLYRRLGADGHVASVPANATVGRGDVSTTASAARDAVEAGFTCLKVKVGGCPVAEDVRRISAARDAVGPDATLRADANGSWEREEARRALAAFADDGVEYVEQPLEPGDLAGHADLRGGAVGVAVDETVARSGLEAVVGAGAADVLVVKPMALGGLDRAREAVDLAEGAGLRAVVTTTVDAVVARVGAVHLAASMDAPAPAGLATARFLADDLAPDPAGVVDGRASVPQDPGHGARVEGFPP